MSLDITIRPAALDDMPTVHQLVEELAIYEHGENEFWLRSSDYTSYFAQGLFECDVAVYQGQVIGMMIYYPTFSTWKGPMLRLEDFIITEKFRRQGVGRLLLDHFIDLARTRNMALVIWEVLDWNTPAINFYKKYNTIFDTDWWNVKIILGQKPDGHSPE